MKSLRAQVHNGQIVLDEPEILPEGTVVHVVVEDGLSPAELEELDEALEESVQQFARGEIVEARTVAERLLAKP